MPGWVAAVGAAAGGRPRLPHRGAASFDLRGGRFDVDAAHAHDLFAVGVLWGYGTRQELVDAGADAIVAHPAELVELAERL
jgi:hypothetical protein